MIEITESITVILATTIKFMGGPLTGLAFGLPWWQTAICSCIGMMLAVVVCVYGGQLVRLIIQKYFTGNKPKPKFTRTTRFAVKVKMKLGIFGIAFLTPLLFTPIGGSVLSISFRYSKRKIIGAMFLSAIFWSLAQTLLFYGIKAFIVKQ